MARPAPSRISARASSPRAWSASAAAQRRKLTILVATSGDTGGAVAAAFHGRPWVDVVVLYPQGPASRERQAQQLACWGGNVRTFAVRGTFDDCQRMVKEAFADPALAETHQLSSANSINVGRLLPQMVYYAKAGLRAVARERPARQLHRADRQSRQCARLRLGAPRRPADRRDRAGDQCESVDHRVPAHRRMGAARRACATLASAMDVGNPSNMERLRALHPDFEELQGQIGASSVDDIEIRGTIRRDSHELDRCGARTRATAAKVFRRLLARGARGHWVIVATAHPAKFNEIVEPQTGRAVPMPPSLARLLSLPRQEKELDPTLEALRAELQKN